MSNKNLFIGICTLNYYKYYLKYFQNAKFPDEISKVGKLIGYLVKPELLSSNNPKLYFLHQLIYLFKWQKNHKYFTYKLHSIIKIKIVI